MKILNPKTTSSLRRTQFGQPKPTRTTMLNYYEDLNVRLINMSILRQKHDVPCCW